MLLETNKNIIGAKIREFRKLKKMTQFELAEKVGLNEKQISRIEMGLNYPTYMTFVKLIDVLEIDISNFIKNPKREVKSGENKIIHLLKGSSDVELNMYYNVITLIKNNINSLHLTY